jgi:hypothetical protein
MRSTEIMVEFDSFDDFCAWAVSAGYQDGKKMCRKSKAGPFSADNCFFTDMGVRTWETEAEKAAAQWDAFITPIREQHRETLERLNEQNRKVSTTTVWRYEHPDLVREGIVFEASR